MEIVNQTPFQLAWIPGRLNFPGHSLTLVVKATYSLKQGDKALLAEEQLFPTGDEYYPDDDDREGSLRYASDFAYLKPRADVLLVGKCHQPGGSPAQACRVTFRVGNRTKSLVVLGDRYWKGMLSTISDPVPFAQMELRYENSYGGEGYSKNPIGKGYSKKATESGGKLRWLPNILHPNDNPDSPGKRLEPAGFGPLALIWQQRQKHLGTYKNNYLETRWPWFPKDFSASYFNAAPTDLQADGYLRGDEELFFENLHPEERKYESQLPGVRARCFVKRTDASGIVSPLLEEVPMNLDTLWVDMENETLVLVWRGWTQVTSEDLEDLDHIFILSESLDEPPKDLEKCSLLFHESLEGTEEQADEAPASEPEKPVDIDEEIANVEAETRAQLLEAGLRPDNPPLPSEEEKDKEREIILEMGFEEEKPEGSPMTRELVYEQFKRGEPFTGLDLTALDLSQLSLTGIQLHGCILTGTNFSGSNLSGADLTDAVMPKTDFSGTDLSNALLVGVDLTEATLNRADFRGAALNGAVLENASLVEANLEHVNAEDALFSGADLSNATLINSILRRADFSACTLDHADFSGSNLSEASVEGAKGHRMKMEKANLTELRASEGCEFTECSFREALAPESIWENSDLTAADLSFSLMQSVDFTSARLERANLSAADMKFSRFNKANLREAKLVKTNLFQGSLKKADLSGADLRGSNLYGVEFLDSILHRTMLDHANIKMTKLKKQN